MKGISPLLAGILLIAFTVAIAGIISVWLPNLISSQTETVSSTADKAAKCATSSLNIRSVRFKTGSNFINVTTEVATGSEKLRNFTVVVEGGGRVNSSGVGYTTTDFSVGDLNATNIDVTGGATIPPSLVKATAFCQTTYPITTSCKSGDPCMIG